MSQYTLLQAGECFDDAERKTTLSLSPMQQMVVCSIHLIHFNPELIVIRGRPNLQVHDNMRIYVYSDRVTEPV